MSSNQPNVYISYRHEGSVVYVGRIYDRLRHAFGAANIVIRPLNHLADIHETLDSVDVMLVIIGSQWATVADDTGQRLIGSPDDFVYREVEAALEKPFVSVIPVLVGGAVMPGQFLEGLNALSSIQAYPVRGNPDFHSDMGTLIRHIRDRAADMRSRSSTKTLIYDGAFFQQLLEVAPETIEANRNGQLTDEQLVTVNRDGVGREDASVLFNFVVLPVIGAAVCLFTLILPNRGNSESIMELIIVMACCGIPIILGGILQMYRRTVSRQNKYGEDLVASTTVNENTGVFTGVHYHDKSIQFYIDDKLFFRQLNSQNASNVEQHLRKFEGQKVIMYTRQLDDTLLSLTLAEHEIQDEATEDNGD